MTAPPRTIRVFVVSGVRLYREGLSEILGRRPAIDVAGGAADIREATTAIRRLDAQPDIVLLDVAQLENLQAAHELLAAFPRLRILAVTVPAVERDVLAYAEAGVIGLVTADASLDELVAALERAARDEALISPRMAATLVRRLGALTRDLRAVQVRNPLTIRELEIMRLIDDGLSNKQIAQRLSIELPTVKNHVHHILDKLGVHRRGEAAARLRRGGARVPQTD